MTKNYLEDWMGVIEEMGKRQRAEHEAREKPVLDGLTILRTDPTAFPVMLEAMIRYADECANSLTSEDAQRMKCALIAVQLRAAQMSIRTTI